MSPPLTYLPAYLGLYVSLVLAIACNAFLDIRYGQFGTEVLIWAVVQFVTLWVGWSQRGTITDRGRKWQKSVALLALVASVLFFLPVWGLPRGGIYMLAAVQAAYNCVTTTRRHLHLGLLVAAVMVMFAASHFRADWTMLFYLIPFVIAAVFTLVAEQIDHRAVELRAQGLGKPVAGGQGVAIVAASSVILLLAGLLYLVTPQVSWDHLSWRYGAPGRVIGPGEASLSHEAGPSGGSGAGAAGQGSTLQRMRSAALRPGMPLWQAEAMAGMADLLEFMEVQFVPVKNMLAELWKALRQWLQDHLRELIGLLILLMILALLAAYWRLLREARINVWLRTRVDYVRFVVLRRHASGPAGAAQLYAAMQRLFELQDQPRPSAVNSREYLVQLSRVVRSGLRPSLVELTLLFEDARYGPESPGVPQLSRMLALYRELFRHAT